MALRNLWKRFGWKTKTALALLLAAMLFPPLFMFGACPFLADVQTKPGTATPPAADALPAIEGYARPEESTYLTYPEWFIVYSSEEYANFLQAGRPSDFPYFSSIWQYWCSYCAVYQITRRDYGFNAGDHLMLWVIGVSYSGELALKGIYENIFGRLTEWTSGGEKTDEDRFAHTANKEYVAFIYDRPWFEFSFAAKLSGLWAQTPLFGRNWLRKWERKFILSLEFGGKAIYGGLMTLATRAVYGTAPTEIYATAELLPEPALQADPRVQRVADAQPSGSVLLIPRYRQFTEIVPQLARHGVEFRDIAGNDTIFLTALVPREWNAALPDAETLFAMEILTQPERKRLGISAPVRSLHAVIAALDAGGAHVEHLYDY